MRPNLRFRGPTDRLHSYRFSVDNVDKINMTELSSALAPFAVFLKAPTAIEVCTSIEIYVPKGGGFAFLVSAVVVFCIGVLFILIGIYLQMRQIGMNNA